MTMWNDTKKAPIAEFIGWVLTITIFVQGILMLLEPCSILFAESKQITFGYIIYAILGIVFATPTPMIALFITLKRHQNISVKQFCKRIFKTENIARTIIITGIFCLMALCFAILNGKPNGSPWYLFILALPVLIIGGGVEEIGWRGFLQPELEKKFPFPVATVFVSVIWYVWHLPIWFQPTSNHYGDSLLGFAVTILIWSFAAAAIFKATKSVFACVFYHTFINAIGATYDWNSLFDAWPGNTIAICYRALLLIISIVVWVLADKKERTSSEKLSANS